MAFPIVNVPNKFHNETLIDAELVVETDGEKVLCEEDYDMWKPDPKFQTI